MVGGNLKSNMKGDVAEQMIGPMCKLISFSSRIGKNEMEALKTESRYMEGYENRGLY